MTVKQLKRILKHLDGDMTLIISCEKTWYEIESFLVNENELIGMIKAKVELNINGQKEAGI